jgi:putative oxidoreductase
MELMLAHNALMLGEILVGFYFFFFFFWNYCHRKDAMAAMRASHIPFVPFVFGLGLCIQLITGLYIMIGIYTALSALLLMVFAIFATFIFHRFWTIEPGPVRTLNTIIFIGNLTVTLGALLLVFGMSLVGL